MTLLRTRIWLEEAEPDNPFATRAAFCHGYDVHGQMLGQAGWADMVFLLFTGERPGRQQAALLDALSVALANAGPRDPAVHAAMCAGVGGSTAAAALMAALAVGAGQVTGAREVWAAMQAWQQCGTELPAWQAFWGRPASGRTTHWPACDHRPGFEAHGVRTATTVLQTLSRLAALSPGRCLPWLSAQREAFEAAASGQPLAMAGVAAAALVDLGLSPDQGEMLHLLLRLPGAAAHALEQKQLGHKNFPFFELELLDDPARPAPAPAAVPTELAA
jgi:citrate synthase